MKAASILKTIREWSANQEAKVVSEILASPPNGIIRDRLGMRITTIRIPGVSLTIQLEEPHLVTCSFWVGENGRFLDEGGSEYLKAPTSALLRKNLTAALRYTKWLAYLLVIEQWALSRNHDISTDHGEAYAYGVTYTTLDYVGFDDPSRAEFPLVHTSSIGFHESGNLCVFHKRGLVEGTMMFHEGTDGIFTRQSLFDWLDRNIQPAKLLEFLNQRA